MTRTSWLILLILLIAGTIAGHVIVRLGCAGPEGCVSFVEALQKTADVVAAAAKR
jgi:hypothetical protein